jgi:hypothetical protein
MCQSAYGVKIAVDCKPCYAVTHQVTQLGSNPQSQKPTEKGTETRIRKQLCGIMALPTKRQLVKVVTHFYSSNDKQETQGDKNK